MENVLNMETNSFRAIPIRTIAIYTNDDSWTIQEFDTDKEQLKH